MGLDSEKTEYTVVQRHFPDGNKYLNVEDYEFSRVQQVPLLTRQNETEIKARNQTGNKRYYDLD